MERFSARLLIPEDQERVEAFLLPRTPFAFFLRSDLVKGGLCYGGCPYQADYFGAFQGPDLAGILAHGWMGNVQVFAFDREAIPALADVWKTQLRKVPRTVELFQGPSDQVARLLSSVGMDFSFLRRGGEVEGLFTLSLDGMAVPGVLRENRIAVRRAQEDDVDFLTVWRHDYFVEAVKAPLGLETRKRARKDIVRRVEERELFVLEEGGEAVSFCGAGGFLSDWVNVGPVWTPPDKRNRGYGRAVAAGALRLLREEGRTHAVLFAVRPEAQRIYRSIGFSRVGDWMFDFLIRPVVSF